jgi:hypothetical protein
MRRGQREAGGDQRGTDSFARFRHGFVRQADDRKSGQSRRDLHLHVDGAGFNALKRDG